MVAGDMVRALAVASVVVGTWRAGLVACALFLLVLGGTLVPRAIGAPAGLDVAYCVTLLFAAWAAQLEWYAAVDWLDLAVHAVATGLVAVLALLRAGALAGGRRAGGGAGPDRPGDRARCRGGGAVGGR